MFNDVRTVMWKEGKSLFRYQGSRSRFLLVLLSPIIFAVIQPLRDGPEWAETEASVVLSVLVSVILVAIAIPDSFAGERERHTLGTLLASRLPDRAILFGKLAVPVAFAWGGALVFLGIGLVTVNLAHWDGELILFPRTVALANLGLSFLLSTLAAGAGVLVSLRSATVQAAAQTLTAIFFIPPMLLTVVLLLFHDQLREVLGGLSGEQILVVVLVAFAVVDLVVHVSVLARFQRARLSLD